MSENREELRSAREQVKQAATRVEDAGLEEELVREVTEAADAIVENLTGIEQELVQTKSRGFEDPLNFLVELFDAFSNRFDAPPEGFLIDGDHGALALEARSQCGQERFLVE